MMSMAKCKFDFLKTKGKWGAKSPDDEKIVAMAAEINSLKGKLKLDPKLSAIAGDRGGTHKIVKNILLTFLIFELGDPKIYMSIR
jgi:hypothetical protein